jgi:hypothetical protein
VNVRCEVDDRVGTTKFAYLLFSNIQAIGRNALSPNIGSTPKVGAIDGRALVPVSPTQPASAAIEA